MEDRRLFFALLAPVSVLVFLGIPTILLKTVGPTLAELRATVTTSALENAPATDHQINDVPRCSAAEEAALVGRLRTATQPAAMQPVVEQLWECWLGERGSVAQDILDSGIELMSSGQLSAAARIFQSARAQYPGWTEANNKLATVYFLQDRLQESKVLCRDVLEEKPHHFGAASGLVQVLVGLGELDDAETAALELVALNHHLGDGLLASVRDAQQKRMEHKRNEL